MMTIEKAISAFTKATGIKPTTTRSTDNWQFTGGTDPYSGFESYRGLCEPSEVLDAIRKQRQHSAAWKAERFELQKQFEAGAFSSFAYDNRIAAIDRKY